MTTQFGHAHPHGQDEAGGTFGTQQEGLVTPDPRHVAALQGELMGLLPRLDIDATPADLSGVACALRELATELERALTPRPGRAGGPRGRQATDDGPGGEDAVLVASTSRASDRAGTSGASRSDRVLDHGGLTLPVRVLAGEPIEVVGVGMESGSLVIELHNPSTDAYSARGKVLYTGAGGRNLGSHEFHVERTDPLRTSKVCVEASAPREAAAVSVVVGVRLLES